MTTASGFIIGMIVGWVLCGIHGWYSIYRLEKHFKKYGIIPKVESR